MSQIESPLPQQERLPHSTYGLASFILACFAIAMCCAVVGIFAYKDVLETYIPHNWGQGGDPDPLLSTVESIFRFVALSSFVAAFAALMLGIAGLCQPRTCKAFSLWGLLLSMFPCGFWVFIIMAARAGF